ncbi:glycerol-3-phosphate dehydrogenase [Elstera cyanobacteriorum]|uniref:glycerol-3-phosphate dehydrogenase n=1 Tax=Elstera cyanobacteriorum TaxID=2022747 RepID=UPI0023537B41|nr:glycerol-3-phosphate dehydrogenase [Elstera cyanobacteriorum]MCK6443236.1 glycerol-3-phosphate dehydrogenase [Elstera cyanobacteriorum]
MKPEGETIRATRGERMEQVFDLAIIGGGINGCGIARDAVGRGWSVYLCEQNDLASGTSSWSTKLIHGGLRYLEHYEFRLVREALIEREILWSLAPHIIWPLRFVLPHHRGLRPQWLLRLGLFLYDHIGGRKRLPATRTLDLTRDAAGEPLKPGFTRGFEYSDCWVQDARLVVLNAMDAKARGATVETGTRFVSAERKADRWVLTVQSGDGVPKQIQARTLVNAAGPWVAEVLSQRIRSNSQAKVRLVQGSHIVVRKIFDHDRCYIFQNADGRIIFAIPYEREFTLIGTTDQDYQGDPAKVAATPQEIAYLCAAASEYFKKPVQESDVVWTYSGVRPLYDDGASKAQEATRDYVLTLDAPGSAAPLLSVFGGKITTYRRLAEAVLDKLGPLLPEALKKPKGWTGGEPLPGGDFPVTGFADLLADVQKRYPFLAPAHAWRLARTYGTRAHLLLGGADSAADLGRNFGADLTEREVLYLMKHEWARRAEDILWRRSKLGLHLSAADSAALDQYMAAAAKAAEGAA